LSESLVGEAVEEAAEPVGFFVKGGALSLPEGIEADGAELWTRAK
jgi:hypothetical protein